MSTSSHPAPRVVRPRFAAALAALLAMLLLGLAGAPAARADASDPSWTATWGVAEGSISNLGDCNPCSTRQTMHTSIGGGRVRLVLTNLMGTVPLVVAGTNLSLPAAYDSSASLPGSRQAVTFDGHAQVTIPAGGTVTSDPVAYSVAADSDLQVSNYFTGNAQLTQHVNGTRNTSFVWRGSDQSSTDSPGAASTTPASFFVVSEIDVLPADGAVPPAGSVVLLGDSITDGTGSTADADDRWGNLLATRLNALPAPYRLGVSNSGISGNRILLDGTGPSAVSRFSRDVVDRAGARSVIILEGINDIRQLAEPVDVASRAAELEAALTGMAQQAHAAGIRVVGATILPWKGYASFSADREAVRQAVNTWIRTIAVASGVYDAAVDFDAVLDDPGNPGAMRPSFDSGDHLHPGPAGYQAMAHAVDPAELGAYPRPGTVSLLAPAALPRGVTTHLTVKVTAAQDVHDTTVHFAIPAGWTFDSAPTVDLGPLAAGGSAVASIAVTAAGTAGQTKDTDAMASVSFDGMVASASQPIRVASPDGAADTTPPTTTITVTPESPGASGWYTRPATVAASAVDDGGDVVYVEYRVDGGPWAPLVDPVALGDGAHTVEAHGIDAAGNVSPTVSRTVDVDTAAPLVTASADAASRTVTATASDAASGVARVEYRIDGGAWALYSSPLAFGAEATAVELRAVDAAGNVSTTAEAGLPAAPPAPPAQQPVRTTSSVRLAKPASARYGTAVRLSATVGSASGARPTGRVTVKEGSRTLASAKLVAGKASVPLPKTLSVGRHRLTVAYAGSDAALPASATTTVTVAKAKGAVHVTAAATTTAKRATVRIRVASAGARSGKAVVLVTRSGTSVRTTAKIPSSGSVAIRLPRLSRAGSYTVKVVFPGSATTAKASGTARLTVKRG